MRFIMLLGLAALSACGFAEKADKMDQASSEADEKVAPEPEVPVGLTDNAVGEVPAQADIDMPAFAPQYPGSEIRRAVKGAGRGKDTHEVRLATKDDAARIFDFYRDRFAAAGLKKTAEFLSGGTGMMSAAGRNGRASIAIAREGDHNIIIVTFSEE